MLLFYVFTFWFLGGCALLCFLVGCYFMFVYSYVCFDYYGVVYLCIWVFVVWVLLFTCLWFSFRLLTRCDVCLWFDWIDCFALRFGFVLNCLFYWCCCLLLVWVATFGWFVDCLFLVAWFWLLLVRLFYFELRFGVWCIYLSACLTLICLRLLFVLTSFCLFWFPTLWIRTVCYIGDFICFDC